MCTIFCIKMRLIGSDVWHSRKPCKIQLGGRRFQGFYLIPLILNFLGIELQSELATTNYMLRWSVVPTRSMALIVSHVLYKKSESIYLISVKLKIFP